MTQGVTSEIAMSIRAYTPDDMSVGVVTSDDVEAITMSRMLAAGLAELLSLMRQIDEHGSFDGDFIDDCLSNLSEAECQVVRHLILLRDAKEACDDAAT